MAVVHRFDCTIIYKQPYTKMLLWQDYIFCLKTKQCMIRKAHSLFFIVVILHKPFQPFLTFVTTTVVIIFALGYLIDFVAIKGENTIKIEIAGKSFLMKIYLTLFSAKKCRKLS